MIYILDWKSLYPAIYIQCNLNKRIEEGGWNGGGFWITQGNYDDKKMDVRTEVLKELYIERDILKKNKDPSEQGVKIFMNSYFGATANPVFKNIHDYIAAEDCTQIGQQWIKYVFEEMENAGYTIIYGDTDSCFVDDKFNDEERLVKKIEEIVSFIKSTVPFPLDEFTLKIDARLKYLKFFHGKSGELSKKNYLYIDIDNKMVIKGMQIIKSNTSSISKKIFTEHLKPQIMQNMCCDFDEEYILKLIEENSNIEDLAQQIKVKKPETYEKEARAKGKEAVSGQYKLSLKFGEGRHKLLKLKSKGNNEYVKASEFKGKISDLDLSHITETELGVFIKKKNKGVDKKWF